jgi:hypothetical protein
MKEDFPEKRQAPAKYDYIFKLGQKGQQWRGERPCTEAYNSIVRGIYNEHLKTHSAYG